MMRKIEKKDIYSALQILRKNWPFFLAFAIMAIYLKTTGPMNNISGDAADIWHTIKSFFSGNIVPSYVLYKGFASVYPYAWLYQLSQWFGVGEFFFIKLFHCFLFAYISSVGFPYFIEKILHIEVKNWRKVILILILFWLWQANYSFNQLMVDLPSLAAFLLLLNSSLKITTLIKGSFGRYLYTGLLLGLNMCISGQYSLPAVCVAIYIVIKTIPRSVLKDKTKRWGAVFCLVLLFVSLFAVRSYNTYFEKTVTDPLREKGAVIYTGNDWLSIGFARLIGVQRSNCGPQIPDNRGLSIIKDTYGDQYEDINQQMIDGKIHMTMFQYFKLVLKYPLDFLSRYANRLFLALSPSNDLIFSHLFVAYTLLFVTLIIIKKRCKTLGHFFSANLLLFLSFIFSIAPLIILNIELRCVMQIQGLIYSAAILDDTLWQGIATFCKRIKEQWKVKSIQLLRSVGFPYVFAVYILFLVLCFSHIASLFEMIGVNPTYVLFKF